jgi:arylsulfatase A-like enzyme
VHYFDPHSIFFYHPKHDFTGAYSGPLPRNVVLLDIQNEPEALSEADVQYVRDLYDGEIAFTDRWVGKLVREIEKRAGNKKTMIFLTADHGEEFKDHGQLGHGKYCYNELLRVPLILAGDVPGALRGKVVRDNAEIRGLARTIAEVCGVANHPFEGANLFDAAGASATGEHAFGSQTASPALCISEGSYAWGEEFHRWSLVFRDWKLLDPLKGEAGELYHLAVDPGEQADLWKSDRPEAVAAREFLSSKLIEVKRGTARIGDAVDIGDSDIEHLRAMGYVR